LHQLRDGKLYLCPAVTYAPILNKKFGVDFKITENDFLDIYGNINAHKIRRFLSSQIPFCSYCVRDKADFNAIWHRSNKAKDEWIET
jgi:hypothetical protein